MKKPEVENPKLKKIVARLWDNSKNAIGNGSTADAIRHERKTGKSTKNKYHSQKGDEYIIRLENWLRSKTKPKSDKDKRIAREIITDLKDALSK